MRTTVLALSILLTSSMASAQTAFEAMLGSIETNNLTLKALRQGLGATEAESMTGLLLDNPEVSFGYQWGTPKGVEDKMMLEVMQSFDFATLSGNKKRVAQAEVEVAKAQYLLDRREVMAESCRVLTQLAYYNRVCNLYDGLSELLDSHIKLSEEGVRKGSVTIIDHQALLIEELALNADRLQAIADKEELENTLLLLNGQVPCNYTTPDYVQYTLPADFEQWYTGIESRSPELLLSLARINLGQRETSLAKSEGLPNFSLGYTNELVRDDNHHGFAVGFSLPLWGNKGRVKAANAKLAAAVASADDEALRLKAKLKTSFNKTLALKEIANKANNLQPYADYAEMLKKQFDLGQIHAIDYVSGLRAVADTELKRLELDRDYNLSLAELYVFTL